MDYSRPPHWLPAPLLDLLFAVCVCVVGLLATSNALAQAPAAAPTAATVRGRVEEVKGQFVKIVLDAGGKVASGAEGRLYRRESGRTPLAEIRVTTVADGYVVGKVDGTEPAVGDAVLLLAAGAPPAARTTTGGASSSTALIAAVGSSVTVELSSGTKLADVSLVEVDRDEQTGEVRLLKLRDTARGKNLNVGLGGVAQVLQAGNVIYTGESADQSTENATAAANSSTPRKPRLTRKEIEAERAAEAARLKEEARAAWLARLADRGIRPWAELTDEQHDQAIAERKELADKIRETFPALVMYETKQFLFLTNIPPQQSGPYIANLDSMYEMMRVMYGLDKGARVWRGKALVVAFLEQREFIAFEQAFMKNNPSQSIYGLCHQYGSGDVLISCYRGDRAEEFAQMLVHETSHGFIHRYKTPIHLPSWVNEGMADYIGAQLVPVSKSVPLAEAMALQRMQQTGSMGGNFINGAGNIEAWQYGLASHLTSFLIRTDPKKYVQFIESLKEGLSAEEALQASYEVNYPQLVALYGRFIGVPNLRP